MCARNGNIFGPLSDGKAAKMVGGKAAHARRCGGRRALTEMWRRPNRISRPLPRRPALIARAEVRCSLVAAYFAPAPPLHVNNVALPSVQGAWRRNLGTKSTWLIFGWWPNRLFSPRCNVLHGGKGGTRCSPTHAEAPPLQARSTILKNIAPSPFRTSVFVKKSG